MDERSSLKIEKLGVRYGEFTAIPSLSMEILKGQIVSLIGTNGAGKSSLMNAIAGVIPPSSGKIWFEGEQISGKASFEIVKKGLCLIPQGGRCFDRMTVEDNLLMGSYPREARKRRKESLEKVYRLFPDLYTKRKEAAGTLSGGQRQMTAIGRSIMSCPKCLMFDEISLGLAPIVIGELYSCIQRLNAEEGLTIILVEQDIERVLQISDICHIMLKGELVLSGRAEDLSKEEIRAAYFGVDRERD